MQIRDPFNGKIIYEHYSNLGFWVTDEQAILCNPSEHGTKVRPAIKIETKNDGFNVIYTFHNYSNDTASIGEFYLGKIKLDSTIYYRNTGYTFQEEEYRVKKNILFMSPARVYPSTSSYSPVTVLRDSEYIIGISVIYPFMDYKHTINQLIVGTFYDDQPAGWDLIIQVNKNCNGQQYYKSGDLAPGEYRKYELYFRVKKVRNIRKDWRDVISPYKDYFDRSFAPMSYKQNRNPILGYHGVSDHLVNLDNPYGYWTVKNNTGLYDHPFRPDQKGFKSTTDYLLRLLRSYSFKRIMVWAPTGLYLKHPQRNYPFQFTSQWYNSIIVGNDSEDVNRMNDAVIHFKKLTSRGYKLGLWWGHAIYVSRFWDSANFELFNPENISHWELSFRELDIAKETEVSDIGLDSFNDLPGWDQVVWLDTMINRTKKKIKFVSEQYSFDVIHTRAAFFYAPWNVSGPHELADYLVPKNEKWIQIIPENVNDINQYMKESARNGYNPCIMTYLGAPIYHKYKTRRTLK